MKETFQSTKLIDGFSTCFRQWKSAPIHCSMLHGYSIKFKVTFEGELDYRNWIVDFGFMKRGKSEVELDGTDRFGSIDQWFKHMFDHSVIVSNDEPFLEWFQDAQNLELLQLRVVDQVGCEMFAKIVYNKLSDYLDIETDGRVKVCSVECFEHEKNSAIYSQQ